MLPSLVVVCWGFFPFPSNLRFIIKFFSSFCSTLFFLVYCALCFLKEKLSHLDIPLGNLERIQKFTVFLPQGNWSFSLGYQTCLKDNSSSTKWGQNPAKSCGVFSLSFISILVGF